MSTRLSKNYQGYGGERWATNTKSDASGDYQPVAGIFATGVKFINSSTYEGGFGCGLVGVTDLPTAPTDLTEHPAENAVKLHFDFDHFEYDGKRVDVVDSLLMAKDGSVYAVLPAGEIEKAELDKVRRIRQDIATHRDAANAARRRVAELEKELSELVG